MTIICIDKQGVIATDSRRTHVNQGRKTGAFSDTFPKLKVPDTIMRFRGERVLAYATCGTVKGGEKLLASIRTCSLLKNALTGLYKEEFNGGKLVVITETKRWLVGYSDNRLALIDLTNKPVFAIGSRADIAEKLMGEHNWSADMTVEFISSCTPSCGGPVHYGIIGSTDKTVEFNMYRGRLDTRIPHALHAASIAYSESPMDGELVVHTSFAPTEMKSQ